MNNIARARTKQVELEKRGFFVLCQYRVTVSKYRTVGTGLWGEERKRGTVRNTVKYRTLLG